MQPEELASRHPFLFHLTAPEAWPLIQAHGLWSTSELLKRSRLSEDEIARLSRRPRTKGVSVQTVFGDIEINDNKPLSVAALSKCLDDNLTPDQWCEMLAGRVFLWADEKKLRSLRGAQNNRNRPRLKLVIDTLRFARAYARRIQLSPINSGSTIYRPARRGYHTFAPMKDFATYRDWADQRRKLEHVKSRDRVKEVVVPGGVPDIADYVVDVWV